MPTNHSLQETSSSSIFPLKTSNEVVGLFTSFSAELQSPHPQINQIADEFGGQDLSE